MEKQRYKAVCSECGQVFYAHKSIAQEMGILEFGSGSCTKCKTFLNLTFDEKEQIMITQPHEKYWKERQTTIKNVVDEILSNGEDKNNG